MQENRENIEIDLLELFSIIMRKIVIILLVAAFCTISTFVFFKFIVSPVYTAETLLYVNNNSRGKLEDMTGVNLNDINASQKLVNTYIVILQSDNLTKQVMSECNITEDIKQFKSMVSMKAVNNTEVLSISVTTTNPVKSADIANCYADVGSEEIMRIVKAGSVEVVNPAIVPDKPSGPQTVRNSLIAGFLGAAITAFAVVLIALLDTTVKDEDDIKKHYDIAVLGEIPDINHLAKGGYRYARYSQYGG